MTAPTTAAPRPASIKQRDTIRGLCSNRQLPEAVVTAALEAIERPDLAIGDASKLIETFIKAPRKTRTPAPATTPPAGPDWKTVDARLPAVPDAFYAIHIDALTPPLLRDMAAGQPVLFLEVATKRGWKRLRKLLGAPGGFRRVTLTPAGVLAAIEFLESDPVRHSRAFADFYSVCGKCAADLTDDVSRRARFGPTCRAILGIEV